jgi:transcriptional regulator with XRE-family HTH domain
VNDWGGMNRNEVDWPAVRVAVDARMKEQGLSTAEVASKMNMAESTLRGFLDGRTRPHGYTVGSLNDALGLPWDHLHAIAEKREPHPEPPTRVTKEIESRLPRAKVSKGIGVGLLGLVDIEHGAALRAESHTEAVRVARELSAGMTRAERIAVHEFLTNVAAEVRWPS